MPRLRLPMLPVLLDQHASHLSGPLGRFRVLLFGGENRRAGTHGCPTVGLLGCGVVLAIDGVRDVYLVPVATQRASMHANGPRRFG
jgi:hypothetical protein